MLELRPFNYILLNELKLFDSTGLNRNCIIHRERSEVGYVNALGGSYVQHSIHPQLKAEGAPVCCMVVVNEDVEKTWLQ